MNDAVMNPQQTLGAGQQHPSGQSSGDRPLVAKLTELAKIAEDTDANLANALNNFRGPQPEPAQDAERAEPRNIMSGINGLIMQARRINARAHELAIRLQV